MVGCLSLSSESETHTSRQVHQLLHQTNDSQPTPSRAPSVEQDTNPSHSLTHSLTRSLSLSHSSASWQPIRVSLSLTEDGQREEDGHGVEMLLLCSSGLGQRRLLLLRRLVFPAGEKDRLVITFDMRWLTWAAASPVVVAHSEACASMVWFPQDVFCFATLSFSLPDIGA